MHALISEPQVGIKDLDLDPYSRSHMLREMYWNEEHARYAVSKVLVGSGDPSLVGKAKDFALVLDETPPVIQPLDMICFSYLASWI